jgi:hypothetical protein
MSLHRPLIRDMIAEGFAPYPGIRREIKKEPRGKPGPKVEWKVKGFK